mmetsp:Transcript_2891/g.8466  ORF Transcript_2891/g.8466 Transcript_2891/m.8466 type:complete len:336 (-) Transcript_2891:3110-4117(-)
MSVPKPMRAPTVGRLQKNQKLVSFIDMSESTPVYSGLSGLMIWKSRVHAWKRSDLDPPSAATAPLAPLRGVPGMASSASKKGVSTDDRRLLRLFRGLLPVRAGDASEGSKNSSPSLSSSPFPEVSADSYDRARWLCRLQMGPTNRSSISNVPIATPMPMRCGPRLISECAPDARTQMRARSPSTLTIFFCSSEIAVTASSSTGHQSLATRPLRKMANSPSEARSSRVGLLGSASGGALGGPPASLPDTDAESQSPRSAEGAAPAPVRAPSACRDCTMAAFQASTSSALPTRSMRAEDSSAIFARSASFGQMTRQFSISPICCGGSAVILLSERRG